jgi:hypothetical protein
MDYIASSIYKANNVWQHLSLIKDPLTDAEVVVTLEVNAPEYSFGPWLLASPRKFG